MQQDKEFLGTAPVGRLLFKLALPTVVAQLVNMLYNVVDRIYIGHIEGYGDLALTGVGVCLPLIMIVSAFAALVGSGGAPRASIAMGENDYEKAERILGGCFGLQLIISVILTAVLLLWNKPLLLAFGASENTIAYATEYMSIYAVGTLFVQLTLGMNAFISGQGFTQVSMLSVIIGAAANIVLDPIFIYGLGLGVRGAAIATVLSQAASTVWIILFLLGKRTNLKLRPKYMLPVPRVVLPCVALGLATFVMQSSESVIAICFNTSLRTYGGDIAVGAMTILTSVMQFAMLPMQGVAQGAQPILSYNFGAKKPDRVKRTYKLLLVTCVIYSVTLWAAVMCFPQLFVGMFTNKPELAAFATPMLRIYYAGMVLFGIQIACQMTFVSLGQALCSVTVAIMRKFVLLLPLIYIVPALVENKTTGVYLAEPIADVLAVTFTAILFVFVFKRVMKGLEKEAE